MYVCLCVYVYLVNAALFTEPHLVCARIILYIHLASRTLTGAGTRLIPGNISYFSELITFRDQIDSQISYIKKYRSSCSEILTPGFNIPGCAKIRNSCISCVTIREMHPTTTTALKAQIRARDRNEGNIDNCIQIFFFNNHTKDRGYATTGISLQRSTFMYRIKSLLSTACCIIVFRIGLIIYTHL